ncbi:hypothetical protein PV325_004017 [Microctonus aethiopoides]|nr:hypothetical protein PV325_004017 [Microctonus aethiopoides]
MSPTPIRTGETIVLSCISQGNPPPMYLWFRESVTGTDAIVNSERIHARAGVLIIQSARTEDAGRYVCHVNNTAGSERVELEVTIINSLSIHLAPQQVTIDLGKDAKFQCAVTGQPTPTISWAKDGLPVRESAGRIKVLGNGGSTLQISSITRDDKGMFQCFAKNDYEMVQATAELRLGEDSVFLYNCNEFLIRTKVVSPRLISLYIYAAPQLVYKFIEQTIQPGPSVSLKCIATGNPTPHFTWTLDGFPLPQNDRFMIGQYVTVHSDVISHVNVSTVRVEDGGEYRCTAVNRVAKVHHSARLNIYGLPHVRPMGNYAAVAGETTIIKCPVAGFPIATITWEKGIQPASFRNDEPNSYPSSWSTEDEQVRKTKNKRARVLTKATLHNGRVSSRENYGSNVAYGQVLPTSRRQEVSTNGTLVLHNVDSSTDRGSYTCTARNKQGHYDAQTVQIEVKVPPRIEPFSFPANIQSGARVHVTCVVSQGDIPVKITWLKDGRPLKPREATTHQIDEYDLALRIQSASPIHDGNYTCVASNDAAKVTHTAPLLVHDDLTNHACGHQPNVILDDVPTCNSILNDAIFSPWARAIVSLDTKPLCVEIPPSIAPFSFNKDLSEGVRAQVACVIEKGDPPFTLIWSKDGEPIATSTPLGFGSASTTTTHKTNSPNTIAGLRVTSMDVHSSTIAIDRVTAAHAGNYTCVARNSVAEVSSTAQLVVRGKVIFTESSISNKSIKFNLI